MNLSFPLIAQLCRATAKKICRQPCSSKSRDRNGESIGRNFSSSTGCGMNVQFSSPSRRMAWMASALVMMLRSDVL